MQLVLASTSVYRKTLLEKLGLDFVTASPDVDETRLDNEAPQVLVERLAIAKAQAVSADFPDALVIGSDQVAVIDNEILGKPGTRENAIRQLCHASGRRVVFYTGLCVLNTASKQTHSCVEPYTVTFRQLSQSQIENYIDREQPLNCAGSFKSEGLGIALFEKLQGDDPNTLTGLPLIRTIEFLQREGLAVL